MLRKAVFAVLIILAARFWSKFKRQNKFYTAVHLILQSFCIPSVLKQISQKHCRVDSFLLHFFFSPLVQMVIKKQGYCPGSDQRKFIKKTLFVSN